MAKLYLMILLISVSVHSFSQSPEVYTSSDIFQQLKKLNVLASVLYVGAHPDDENNALLPYFAKEKLYRTAYLSLTRGDGGQNLIGDEQGIELGLIRTQELLAARRVDGAEQYFTRAYEFGFSKSADESLKIWDREKILADVVWVIRKYQPDIIIKRFPPDARAGHGHHAASAILTDEAFTAAADPARFPEQLKLGVHPWQAKRILWNTFNFGGNNTTSEDQLKIDIGGFSPLVGKSYGELGGEARTMHKSQGEGRPRRRGQSFEYFTTTAGEPIKTDLMDGVVTGWARIPGGAAVESMINTIIADYKIDQPQASVPALVQLFKKINTLPEGNWRNKKLEEVQKIIIACSALFIEATSSQSQVVQGDSLKIDFVLNERSNVPVVLKRISIENFDSVYNKTLPLNQNFAVSKTIGVAKDRKISQPYWLEYPLNGGTFEVRDQLMIGKAQNDPSFETAFFVTLEGEDFVIKRPVQYRFIDPVKGDLYEPIPVLPRMELRFTKDNFISLNGNPVKETVQIKSNINTGDKYDIDLQYSKRWSNDKPSVVFDSKARKEEYVTGVFTPLSKEANITEEIHLQTKDGQYDGYTKTIAYDHIPTITYFPRAKANLVKVDVKTSGRKIGYITGAGDKVPQALEQMGYEVTIISEADVTDENLQHFDAIITGIRAYNIYGWLSDKNDILMRYVQNGGNLIVQYLKSNQVGSKSVIVGPYPFSVNPGSRVTEENAVVNFVLPEHPVLNFPNKITAKDFEGWVQERSTYQATQPGNEYETPLSMHDTGEPESKGSLLVAKYGKGNFVYAGLVFFRELPAGVPGAFRIMANLIALPKNEK
jgi:LmbE family N-acetylglucosaminyl deacetylase